MNKKAGCAGGERTQTGSFGRAGNECTILPRNQQRSSKGVFSMATRLRSAGALFILFWAPVNLPSPACAAGDRAIAGDQAGGKAKVKELRLVRRAAGAGWTGDPKDAVRIAKEIGFGEAPGGEPPLLRMPGCPFVYVSLAPEQEIRVYRLEPIGGKLAAVETIAVEGAPGALAVDPERRILFASLRTTSSLASFRIDPETGKLTRLGSWALPKGENTAHGGTDRTGRWLLSAPLAAGKVVVHRIKDDGTILAPAVQTVRPAKTAHCTATDPDNRFMFVPHISPNAVYQFRLDAAAGKLTGAGKAAGGTAKAGPRHLVFHPTWKLACTSDEQGSSITVYRLSPREGLKPIQMLSTLPASFKGQNTTAEVKFHPSGKFLWVSNRGHDSLAGFAIDADSGKLTALGQTPTEKTPRSFDLSSDGRFVLAAGEGSGKLAVYQVDLDTGKLTLRHTYHVGRSLTWVLVIESQDRVIGQGQVVEDILPPDRKVRLTLRALKPDSEFPQPTDRRREIWREHPEAGLLVLLVLVAGVWLFWRLARRNLAPADMQRRLVGGAASSPVPATTGSRKSLKRPLVIATVLVLALAYGSLPRSTRDAMRKTVQDFWFAMRAGRGR
jgi:6-phosphogluconolactonase